MAALPIRLLGFAAAAVPVAGHRVVDSGSANKNVSDVSDLTTYSDSVINDDDVDFRFMTNDFTYTGHKTGVFGSMYEWFGGRSTSDDVRDEIVKGHACQNRGDRDETYYASSLCYWLPEITTNAPKPDGMLRWRGGSKYPRGKSLCGGLSGAGMCVKCSACHNNARGEGGDLDKTTFVEKISLPPSCLGEKEIERRCVAEFDRASAGLKNEDTRCHEVNGRYDHATAALARCDAELTSLPQLINSILPQKINQAQQDLMRKNQRLLSRQNEERQSRQRMYHECENYQSTQHNLRFMNQLMGATPMENLLGMMSFHCSYPHMPIDNHDGSYLDEMVRYNNNHRIYEACKQCDRAKDHLQRAHRSTQSASRDFQSAQKVVPRLQQQRVDANQRLQSWQQQRPQLAQTKAAMDTEWLPQQAQCLDIYNQYTNGKAQAVIKMAPTLYDSSCEKACIDIQARSAGCGVLEGDRPDSALGTGGVEAMCTPPQPSWIMGPFTYGADEQRGQQCNRIQANQPAQHAQAILKRGWLWKKGRVGGWKKRLFVLESGDAVRSAVLRYFTEDPATRSDAEERGDKGIILWDAKGVQEKSGEHYGFKGDEECFKLYHFYRDYRLCVVEGDGGADTRDEWVQLLEQAMVHKTPE